MQKKVIMRQVGTVALRGPDGMPLPSVPIYMEEEDSQLHCQQTGRTLGEEMLFSQLTEDFGKRFEQFIEKKERKDKS